MDWLDSQRERNNRLMEKPKGKQAQGEVLIKRLLALIDPQPEREGLVKTPRRVVDSWRELYCGYGNDPADVITTFEDGACDEMVILKSISFFSSCEHHMLPFFGKAHIAYLPNERVIGISKLARLLEIYTRRLQIQERIGTQVTDALMTYLEPKGAACILQASHLCMCARGVNKQDSVTITSSLTGAFRDAAVRMELFSLIKE